MLSSYDEQHTHASVKISTLGMTVYVTLSGSTKPLHWLHHFLPGASRREIVAGQEIARDIKAYKTTKVVISGYSLGGAIAHVVCCELHAQGITAEARTIGSKRPPRGHAYLPAINYRNRGDIVPLITPWREKIYMTLTSKKWRLPWVAHSDYS